MQKLSLKDLIVLVSFAVFTIVMIMVVQPRMNSYSIDVNHYEVDIVDSLSIVVTQKYKKDITNTIKDGIAFNCPTWINKNEISLFDLVENGDSIYKQKDSLHLVLIRDGQKEIFTIKPPHIAWWVDFPNNFKFD